MLLRGLTLYRFVQTRKTPSILPANRNACLKLTKSFFFFRLIFFKCRLVDKFAADCLRLKAKGLDTTEIISGNNS